jgi:hypothetical protein
VKPDHASAHELGHVLVGEGQSDQNPGAAPLPGTLHIERLMHSGAKLGDNDFPRLLVKGEWDSADLWLDAEETRIANLPQ